LEFFVHKRDSGHDEKSAVPAWTAL